MHSLAFSSKRVHLTFVEMQRFLLRALDITPARADLLFVMSQIGHEDERALEQSQIWRALGVRRSTTSRMLAALEDDGYVGRGRWHEDQRQRRVWLTEKARALLLRIEQLAFRFRIMLTVTFAKRPMEMQSLHHTLEKVRRSWDRSYFWYPWIVRMRWPHRKVIEPRQKPGD